MEVEILHVLELGARRREQLFADPHMRVHRTAHIEEQQHFHRIVSLRHQLDIEQAGIACGRTNRIVEIEFIGRAGARKFAQPAQRDLDIARTQLDRIVEIFELAPIPDLHRFFVSRFAADAHAFGMITVVAERRGALGANPFVAAVVFLFLLFQALLEFLDQLFQAAQRLDLGFLFVRSECFSNSLRSQSSGISASMMSVDALQDRLKIQAEGAIKTVEIFFVLDQAVSAPENRILRYRQRPDSATTLQSGQQLR